MTRELIERELLPCPLCGRQPALNRLHPSTLQIHCTQMHPEQHCVVVTERTEAQAIAAWNTRDQSLSERIDVLERELAIASAHLQAAADWTDENMNNPIMAIASRNCARNGLASLIKEGSRD